MKPAIDNLVKDRYLFSYEYSEASHDELYLSFISLKLAFNAYFSSEYDLECPILGIPKEKQPAFKHSIGYCEEYFKSIVHFQHFFEILAKYCLKQEDPIFLEKNPRISFTNALNKIISLIKNQRSKAHYELAFFDKHKNTLEEINKLRNQIWHKGVYTIKGEAFDLLVGCYVLPLIKDIENIDVFNRYSYLWHINSISCGVKLLDELVTESHKNNPNFAKISLLKRLAKSTYNLPKRLIMEKDKASLESEATKYCSSARENEYSRYEQIKCPVCGMHTLITLKEFSIHTHVDCNYCRFYWNNELEGFDIRHLITM